MKKVMIATTVVISSLVATSALAGKGWKEKRFDKIDQDKNGVITYQEFTQHHQVMFNKLDQNKDGQVTKEEMKAMKKVMRKHRRQDNNDDSE